MEQSELMSGPKGLSVPLDVNFFDHPKVLEAGEKATMLYVQALCLAKRTLSDGFVSDAQIKRFGLSGVAARAHTLRQVGLFRRDDEQGGWWIHDFLEWNRSRAEQEAIVAKRKQAGRKGGRPPNQVGNQSALQDGNQDAKQAGNPEEKRSEEKRSEVENTTTTTGETQDPPSTGRGGGVDFDDDSATGASAIARRAHTVMRYPAAPGPKLTEAAATALGRGWTSEQILAVAAEAADRPDVASPAGWWAKKITEARPPRPEPDPDGATPIEPIRPLTLSRPHPFDCPGGCDDDGLVDTGSGLAQCTGQPIEATA